MAGAGKGKKKAMTAKERKMKYMASLKNDPAKKLAFKKTNKAAVTKHRRNMSEEEKTESKKIDATRHKAMYREKREIQEINPYKIKAALMKAKVKVERSLPSDLSRAKQVLECTLKSVDRKLGLAEIPMEPVPRDVTPQVKESIRNFFYRKVNIHDYILIDIT